MSEVSLGREQELLLQAIEAWLSQKQQEKERDKHQQPKSNSGGDA